MGDLSRIGVAIDTKLLRRFDRLIAQKGYENRSEAFRDLIRDRLVGSAVVAPDAFVVGPVTLIYDHHTRLLPEKLTDLQHEHHQVIISTLHAHLDLKAVSRSLSCAVNPKRYKSWPTASSAPRAFSMAVWS
jgi:CopG family transcriptional regulator, nickel-responsive regulator